MGIAIDLAIPISFGQLYRVERPLRHIISFKWEYNVVLMKNLLSLLHTSILILVLSVNFVRAQDIIIQDDFEDQNLSANPEWTGDLGNFTFFEENGNTLLRLDAPEAGSSQIRTASTTAYGTWEFYIDQDFPPSNGNRGFIFLISDSEDLTDNVNGYAIRTGENSAPNFFRLFSFSSGTSTEILTGELDISGGGPYQIKVTRDVDGEWGLYESKGYGSVPTFVGSVIDNTHTTSSFFGLQLNYTATRANNFYFDDIVIKDGIEPLQLVDVEVESSNSLRLFFTEVVDETSLQTTDFSLNGIQPTAVTLDIENQNEIIIEFENSLDEGVNALEVTKINDFRGNTIETVNFEFTVTNPFFIENVKLVDATGIEIEFSEEPEEADLIPTAFTIKAVGNPSNVETISTVTIRLTFDSQLDAGSYTLIIGEIESVNGWPLTGDNQFEFTVFDQFEVGDLLISEFFYRVPVDWRTAEFDRPRYIEMFNSTDKFLNLRDFTINGENINPETDLSISPNEYLVITRGEPVFLEKFGERNFFEAENFPSLSLTTQSEIVVKTDGGVTVDSLFYRVSLWGGNGVALERRSLSVDATLPENWGESPNQLLGTPGLPNEVEIDNTPPKLTDLNLFRDEGFTLSFDKQLDVETATNLNNYTISPDLGISLIMQSGKDVTLLVSDNLVNNQIYEIVVEGITDLFGNLIVPVTRSIEYLDFIEAEPRELVINEILYRRLQAGAPEFVEIFNRTDKNINLSEWTLSDASSKVLLPSGLIIRGNSYVVFTDTQSFAADNDNVIYMSDWPGLSNNGDAVVLKNGSGTVIDSLFYRPDWGNNTQGVSIERKDPAALSIDRSNWAPSTAEFGSTPAAENTRFEIDATPPTIIFANLFHPDSLEVQFSKFVNLNINQEANQVARTNQIATILSEYQNTQFLINGTSADILFYNPLQANRIILNGSNVQAGEAVSITIRNLSDFQGNVTSEQSIPVAQPIGEGDLIFNEIMFNPISNPTDGLPDQSEYIEIYNTRSYAVSLEGIFLHNQPDENNQITRIELTNTVSKWIPSNGFVVVYPETDQVQLSNSRTGRFFELDSDTDIFGLRANRTSLSLTNSGRQVYLADSSRNVIDMVDYSPAWHNPNLISTQGISLERINPNFDTNDSANWGSNTNRLGGTPARQNTLFQEQGLQPDEAGISLSPNPFSPDGDGFEDNLFINYTLNEPDYMMRIRIYDRYGRLVRTLADGLNAGLYGTVIWDGRSDDGGRNRIGIYIIFVEVYNSANGSRRLFREIAVLARQF